MQSYCQSDCLKQYLSGQGYSKIVLIETGISRDEWLSAACMATLPCGKVKAVAKLEQTDLERFLSCLTVKYALIDVQSIEKIKAQYVLSSPLNSICCSLGILASQSSKISVAPASRLFMSTPSLGTICTLAICG